VESGEDEASERFGIVTVRIINLDTDKQGAIVLVSQIQDVDEQGSHSETRPDWQFEVEPNATDMVFEHSQILVTESTDALLFSFHTYKSQD